MDAEGGIAGNTVQASTQDPAAWYMEGTAVDQLWGRRAFGNDVAGNLGTAFPADIFEATTTSGVEDCPMIKTVISGLNPGWIYGVSAVYWSQATNQNWSVRAAFSAEDLALYARTSAAGAIAGTPTGRTQSDRAELSGFIGHTVADSAGRIHVYIDDKPSTTDYTERTWYDGLLYEEFNVAHAPNPPQGAANVELTATLSFASLEDPNVPGQEHPDLMEHRLHFGTVANLAETDLLSILPQGVNTAAMPQNCQYDQTYYWRVDEVLSGGIVTGGFVWQFQTGPDPGVPECLSRPTADFSGPAGEPDCKVNLYDFAEFAGAWLQCTLIPESACQE